MRGGKSGSRSPKRVSGDGSAPPRFRFGFPVISLFAFLWRVLGCGARQRAAIVYAKHTPRCQRGEPVLKIICENIYQLLLF